MHAHYTNIKVGWGCSYKKILTQKFVIKVLYENFQIYNTLHIITHKHVCMLHTQHHLLIIEYSL